MTSPSSRYGKYGNLDLSSIPRAWQTESETRLSLFMMLSASEKWRDTEARNSFTGGRFRPRAHYSGEI